MVMENSKSSGMFSMFNSPYGSSDPSMNVPLHSASGLSQLSPYLNVDASYLQAQPEFLTLEGASQNRGRFELAFAQIGGMCMTGGAIGGAQGIYHGLRETAAAGHSGKIWRTQMINYFMKQGSASANALGTIAVTYSALGCLFYFARGKKEDSINTVGAATLTGLLYKSTGGLKKSMIGGVAGLAISSIYVALLSKDKVKSQFGFNSL